MPATNSDKRVLPTSVVGSYSVPEWLERLKTDFYQRRISGHYCHVLHAELTLELGMRSCSGPTHIK